jgi:hypothetical protein
MKQSRLSGRLSLWIFKDHAGAGCCRDTPEAPTELSIWCRATADCSRDYSRYLGCLSCCCLLRHRLLYQYFLLSWNQRCPRPCRLHQPNQRPHHPRLQPRHLRLRLPHLRPRPGQRQRCSRAARKRTEPPSCTSLSPIFPRRVATLELRVRSISHKVTREARCLIIHG